MLTVGTSLGPYRIVAPLGAGGMGEVYRAHDPRLGRDVAIKVLPARSLLSIDARARFEREARTISQLSHPHICTLFDVGREGETDYLVMELLEGETLAHRVARGALPVADVLRLGGDIASALDRAHAAGVVHRDLKPANVMLTKSGAKLMDFGLARVAAAPASGAALTASPTMTQPLTGEGAIVGTFEYMAPEQHEGREADTRSDIWALGCVLYEMATGKRAFGGASGASLIAAILKEEPRPISELAPMSPPALEHVVTRCLAKDPNDRWQSVRDVASVLQMTSSASGAASGARSTSTTRPHRAIPLALAILAGALVVGVLWVATGRRSPVATSTQLTFTRLTLQRGNVTGALFSPDGKTVFYSAAWNGGPLELYETRPGFPTSRPMGLSNAHLLSIASDGTMALLLGQTNYSWSSGTIAEVPLSGGVPRRLLDGVVDADLAPNGRQLAVMRQKGGRIRLEMPPGHVLHEAAGDIRQARVSWDGRLVAFVEHPFNAAYDGRGSVVVVDTSGRILGRSSEWSYVGGIGWSPDGREAWFAGSQDLVSSELHALSLRGHDRLMQRFDGAIFLLDVARDGRALMKRAHMTTGIRGYCAGQDGERELGWYDESYCGDLSADGRTLLFMEVGLFGGPQYAVCIRGMDGSPPVRLGAGNAASLSPDGRWVVAIQMTAPPRLLLMPTGAGDSLALRGGPIDQYLETGWMPDGKHVVFSASEPGHASRVWVQDIAGGPPRPVTAEGISGSRVSHDGRFLAGVSRDQRLFICPLDGGEARYLTTLGSNEYLVNWDSGNRSIYTATYGVGASGFRIDVTSGRRMPWRKFSVHDPAGVNLSNVVVTPDGRSYAFAYERKLHDLYLVEGLE